jgi:hypothetical protein
MASDEVTLTTLFDAEAAKTDESEWLSSPEDVAEFLVTFVRPPEENLRDLLQSLPRLTEEGYLTSDQAEELLKSVISINVERHVSELLHDRWFARMGTPTRRWTFGFGHNRHFGVSPSEATS